MASLLWLLLIAAAALGLGCDTTRVVRVNSVTVTIASPANGAAVQLTDSISFAASADNPGGLLSLVLSAGAAQVGSCLGNGSPSHLECKATLIPKDHQADLQGNDLALTAIATGSDGDTAQARVDVIIGAATTATTTLLIDAPAEGTTSGATDSITFQAHATNLLGLKSLALSAGTDALASCAPAASGSTNIACQVALTMQAHAAQLVAGKLTLTAQATDSQGKSVSKSITVLESPLGVSFVQPALTQQTPPVAAVRSPSPVEIAVTGAPQIKTVVVTDENQHTVASFTATPYSSTVTWLSALGIGTHTLTAVATDSQSNHASAQRVVQVSCATDGDCAAGTRCCAGDGQCHAIGAPGADCDCAHPCPLDQGCFPGTCGAPPQKCRPGCNPGSDSPPRVPQACGNENGVIAYCSPLPPDQVTPQNHGGACAPGDGCDVHAQNCPNFPLDRTKPGGPGNPTVPYTCEPVSPTATACFPAGTHPPQDNNPGNLCLDGADTCGNAVVGCTQGYLCVGIVGQPDLGLACSAQCRDPVDPNNYFPPFTYPPQSPDCPNGQYCDQLFGTGGQLVLTGICNPM
jgi:hypothetical protein